MRSSPRLATIGCMVDDARAVENLIHAYAANIDRGNFDGIGELFRHGRLIPAPGFELSGPESIVRLYEGTTRLHGDGTPRTLHQTTNVIIEMAEGGQDATARSCFAVFQQTEHLPLQPIVAGRYHDRFHRVAGVWWFAERRMFVDLTGDLSQHLLIDLG